MDSSGSMSRSSWSGIPWNKHLVSSWSRLPQDIFGTHGSSSVTHICINASDDTISSSSGHSRWPKTLVWSSGPLVVLNRIRNWPYPIPEQTQIWKFLLILNDLNGFLNNLDKFWRIWLNFRYKSTTCKGRPKI